MERYVRLFWTLFSVLSLNLMPLHASENSTTLIDTLILYSDGVDAYYHQEPETRIHHLMEVTNNILTESQLNIKLNPVHILPYMMDENATSSSVIASFKNDTNVSRLRDQFGADLVLIYRLKVTNDSCGIAYLNDGRSDYSFAHVSINCSDYYTAHEIGHTMGLYHSIKDAPDVGYPRGYGIEYEFSTIMTYSNHFHAKRINKYSSPHLECYGYPCGIEEGETDAADAVKALLKNAPLVANFKPTQFIVTEEMLEQAQEQYEHYKKEFEEVNLKLEELYNRCLEAEKEYTEALHQSLQKIEMYQKNKSDYQKLKDEYETTKDNIIKNKSKKIYQNIAKTTKELNNAKLYALLTQKNKLERSYQTYKSSVYDAIQIEYEKAKSYYEELLSLHG